MSSAPFNGGRTMLMHEVFSALRRGDFAAAERLIASAQPAAATLISAADSAMRDHRWRDAAWLWDRVQARHPSLDNASIVKRCLCRNLASLEQFRPDLFTQLVSLPKNSRVGIGASASGHPTIIVQRADGQNIALSPNNQPLAALAAAWAQLKPVFESGQAFCLCGIGDGYLFHQVAQKPPTLFMDTQQAVYLLEPDAHVVLTALMIHDYTGPTGPIEQSRFQWFIGPDWAAELRAALLADICLPPPNISLMLGLAPADIQAGLNAILRDLGERDARHRQTVDAHYARQNMEQSKALFGDTPPRRPRVLLLTTRFSTVLQYATFDAAAAFAAANWETHVLIKPSPHHRILTSTTRTVLAEFQPDLVFQIDHQRQEHPSVFPASLPFACWIQDHMAHLMTRQAGEKVGETDFVLTDAGPLYVHNYGYPRRQMVALSKLTAPPPLLPRPADRGDDLVFVSNASGTPQALLNTLLQKFAGAEADQDFVTEAMRRIVELHAGGDALPTYQDVRRFLRDLLKEMALEMAEDRFTELAAYLNHPICDALYRQQALRWAADAAKELGLSLALCGKGWENHPEFSAHARGPIAPGRALHELTRKAAINLQIVPYLCLHQRLLDGICSGSFFLIRQHVSDVAPQAMLDLLEAQCGSHIHRLDQARACVPPPVRDRFESLVKDCVRCLCSIGTEDPIEMVRAWQEARLLVPNAGVLPSLDAVSFSDASSLRAGSSSTCTTKTCANRLSPSSGRRSRQG